MSATDQVRTWRGRELHGRDGEKLGTIDEIYLDAETREPEWALVSSGVFGTKQSFVPLRGASLSGDGVSVPFSKSTVKASPEIDPGAQLSEPEEAELYRHYGMDHSETESGRDVSGPTADEVTRTIPIRREEVRVERDPITDANVDDATSGPEISSEEREVVLREEEVVAENRAVPKERVRLAKDVETEEREVSETLRKEQIDIDQDAQRR